MAWSANAILESRLSEQLPAPASARTVNGCHLMPALFALVCAEIRLPLLRPNAIAIRKFVPSSKWKIANLSMVFAVETARRNQHQVSDRLSNRDLLADFEDSRHLFSRFDSSIGVVRHCRCVMRQEDSDFRSPPIQARLNLFCRGDRHPARELMSSVGKSRSIPRTMRLSKSCPPQSEACL